MLEGKVITITGSGRGLGRAYVLAAAEAGAKVVVNDIAEDAVDEVVSAVRAAGGDAIGVVSSVADWDGAGELIARTVDEYGRIDGLVNNAGLFRGVAPQDEDEAGLRKIVEVNVLGALFAGTHALKRMAEQNSGTVINVTSGAHLGIAKQGVYGASKGAMASLTYSWAIDMADHGVRVNAISPFALTRMVDEYLMPGVDIATMPDPSSIAPLVVFALSDRAGFTGQVLRLDGKTFTVLDQPKYRVEAGVDSESWSPEAIAQAWDEHVSGFVSRGGMGIYLES